MHPTCDPWQTSRHGLKPHVGPRDAHQDRRSPGDPDPDSGWAVIVLILVAHVLLTLGNANPANGITMFLKYWADRLQLGFRDLFNPARPQNRLVIDYGIPAVFWLVVTWVLVRLVRRLG